MAGRILIVGGVGYLLSAFLGYGAPDAPAWVTEGLVIPATVGEFWMIGYLLFVGIRPSAHDADRADRDGAPVEVGV